MQSFHTIKQNTELELIIQKSRFLCTAYRIQSEENALLHLQKVQKKHWNATHNCYAYQVTPTIQKANDDGEPQGTAGRPILNVLTKNNLHYTLIIITRYFGGIKLGASGLIRAYSKGASDVIAKAGIVKQTLHQELTLTFDYTYLSKVEYELLKINCHIETTNYLEKIEYTIWIPVDTLEWFQKKLNAWTNGQVDIKYGKEVFKEVKCTYPRDQNA